MKKLISILLVSVLLLSAISLSACKKDEPTLKLGLGVVTAVKATDATEDKDGQGQATVTAAAVLVDAEGKIVKAFVDCIDNKASYTVEGTTKATEAKTKHEIGSAYGMKAEGSAKEWFEQVDAFCALIVGKTASEVKALVAADTKGTEEVLNAGCTIAIADFAVAVEKAMANAAPSEATANDSLKLGIEAAQTPKDATEDRDGSNKIENTLFAAALNSEGKIVAASSDCVEVTFTFDTAGASTFDATKEILSKKQKGDSYGMKAAGSAKEWYEQAAAFDAACVGKTPAEVAGLMGADFYGNADLQAAGCTIYVSNLVKAAAKVG